MKVTHLSDHSVVSLILPVKVEHTSYNPSEFRIPNLLWNNSKPGVLDAYKHTVDKHLIGISIPIEAIACKDTNCQQHSDAIAHYHDQVADCCERAAQSCIPKSNNRKRLAGWNDDVSELKDNSIFWDWVFNEIRRPSVGVVRLDDELVLNITEPKKKIHE